MHARNDQTSAFAPKLVSVLREGYGLALFRQDALAGLTVAIVALPLSMAISIASGAGPAPGLFTAIVGGFLISAFGGSRHQIGGPAGAFIVLIAAIIDRHGMDGLFLATIMAGIFMLLLGVLRLGTLIKFIPQPVTIGFTAGIAVIIFASQIRDLLGLTLAVREPVALLPKISVLAGAMGSINPAAVLVSLGTMAIILGLKRLRPHWPGLLIAVVLAAVVVQALGLPIETIGSRFGAVPSSLPAPQLPVVSLSKIEAVLPDALAIALLGSIESLLSAVVADGMTGRRHRSNTELVAQGMANIGSALFGGICATGTIARTATNVRAGAHGPVSGMLHAVYLLLFMLLAAPLMARIPLAALAGILAIVAWNMAEKHAILSLIRHRGPDLAVFAATFLLTVFRDLTEGILVGVLLGAVLFAVRMARLVEVSVGMGVTDQAGERPIEQQDDDIIVYRISGPLFFGSTPRFGEVMARIGMRPKGFILDLSAVPLIDASGADAVLGFAEGEARRGTIVIFAGARPDVRRMLEHSAHHLHATTVAEARARITSRLSPLSSEGGGVTNAG